MSEGLSEKEFQKLSLNFRNVASRFLKCSFRDYHENLKRFLYFIEESSTINEFILENNVKEFNIENIIKEKINNSRFKLPINKSEEITYIYQLLNYISENNLNIVKISYGYGGSNKIQSHVESFNNDIVQPLVNHIVTYLGEMKIDLGLDKKSRTNFTFNREFKGQFNHAEGHGSISSHQNYNEFNIPKLKELSEKFVEELKKDIEIPDENKEETIDFLEVSIQEAESHRPKKSIIKAAMDKVREVNQLTHAGTKLFTFGKQLVELLQKIIS